MGAELRAELMFVSDKIVFLELQKTGCTHIRNLLTEFVGGELIGKHNQVDPDLFGGGRFFLGSIRNPWDWYVSLWAYGCDGRGTLFRNVTRFRGRGWKTDPYSAARKLLISGPNRNARNWKRTYRDVRDAGAFRDWLRMIHDDAHRPEIEDGYARFAAGRFTGLLTYRYLKLFACRQGETNDLEVVSTPDELATYERRRCFIDSFIRNESLETDLFAALRQAGIAVPESATTEVTTRPRTNISSRKGGAAFYYDSATAALIAERDRLVVEKFGYRVPVALDEAGALYSRGMHLPVEPEEAPRSTLAALGPEAKRAGRAD